MNKIVVTGGLGFIGSNLIELLLEKNFYVINIDSCGYASSSYNFNQYNKIKNYKFVKVDLNNKSKVLKILNTHKPKGIFHLAASTHVDRSIENPKDFITNNILATYNLLESIREYSKINKKYKLIHVSTDEIYGDLVKGKASEISYINPSSPYAASKASSNHLVTSYVRTFKLNAVITNSSNNYGPRQHPEKLIPKLIYNILNSKNLPIYGSGNNIREWMYVKDHCNALLKIFKKGKKGQIYNIGSGKLVSNLYLSKKILNLSRKKKILKKDIKIIHVKDRVGHDFRYSLNSLKLKKKIKWKNKTNLTNGLIKTLDWYFKNQNFFKEFKKNDIIRRIG